MYTRKDIRIKAIKILFAYYQDSYDNLKQTEKQLLYSFDETYRIYLSYLAMLGELQHQAFIYIEDAKNQLMPTKKDLNPSLVFLENPILQFIVKDPNWIRMFKNYKVQFGDFSREIKDLFLTLRQKKFFQDYLEIETATLENHKDFVKELYTSFLFTHPMLSDYLDDLSIFWQDEEELLQYMVLETIRKATLDKLPVLPLMKEEHENKEFAVKLLHKTILNTKEYDSYIEVHTANFTIDRITLLDKVILRTAIAELMNFEQIPPKVTINEYIHIAKEFGGAKSGQFINGVMDKILASLKQEEKIIKKGRGLVEN